MRKGLVFWALVISIIFIAGAVSAQQRHQTPPALARITGELERTLMKVDAFVSQTAREIAAAGPESPESRQKVADLCRDIPTALFCALTDVKGSVVVSEPAGIIQREGINALGEGYIRKVLEEQVPVVSKSFQSPKGPYAVSLAYPVRLRDQGTVGALAVFFRPDVSIEGIVKKVPTYVPVEIVVIETDGRIIYEPRREGIGRNLLKDEELQSYRQLVNLGWRAVKSRSGSGSYVPARRKGDPSTRKVAHWDTVTLYGSEWRVIMIKTETADAQYGFKRPTATSLGTFDRALRDFCRNPDLQKALAAGARQRALGLMEKFYAAHRGLYSVQWIDEAGVNRFGYPPESSVVNYNYHDRNDPGDDGIIGILNEKKEGVLSRQLMEGGTGRFFFCPVGSGEDYRGLLYTIIKSD